MISVKNAIDLIREHSDILEDEKVEVKSSVGRVLAETLFSPLSFPPFDQSAMDGYAICSDGGFRYKVIGEIKAGDPASQLHLSKGEAYRIFTGAGIPANTTVVIKQEDVQVEKDAFVSIQLEKLKDGENIRLAGEEINEGDKVMEIYKTLSPGAVGFLVSLGIQYIRVYKKPRIGIVATGNELTPLGEKLTPGKIYESNTSTLCAALQTFGFTATTHVIHDDLEDLKVGIEKVINDNDLIIITGGISVGDYDFVAEVLKQLTVEQRFHKVKQKPGKPIYFGTKNEKVIFGLPGNPAAVLTSFYLYILEALACMTGKKEGFLTRKEGRLIKGYKKSPSLTYFLKGILNDGKITILPAQSSAMLSSFIEANCLVQLVEGMEQYEIDEKAEVILIA